MYVLRRQTGIGNQRVVRGRSGRLPQCCEIVRCDLVNQTGCFFAVARFGQLGREESRPGRDTGESFYARADRGGIAVVEVDSADTIFEATAPWAGVYNDYEVVPVIEIERAVELLNTAVAFRDG